MEEPMSRLTHDLIAEILSRVPYKSLCICKCVCPTWRGIIADPANRKKMAQTLAGFFYRITADSADPRGFVVNYADLSAFPWASVAETYPLLPLPSDSTDCFVSLEDSCDGLFLTSIRTGTPAAAGTSRYMVSNPATGFQDSVFKIKSPSPAFLG
ncbi:putative F-box protein At3g17490 isoform X2 [Triticum urartu]|uniref:putative F-box protein At3g17490 isoform X2 n=1 Tax=Triticum urartu TaxID=4572 RepID=UPI002044082F|nr:putative F-box protein At3g17490 isoform X2 [Triticum urartu]